ncbi:MAG: UDP-3-O-acyl-N-acetylglucosamine deacetylase [Candidatus Omnitrophota bacterium]|nr:UDP-3-O-acyl-N-acetylglucosamine deacetylase [Candidatus Omnitrophota bacterium]
MKKQRTIKGPVTIEGIGLQTGKKVKLSLKSSPADSGISFVRTDLPGAPALNLRSINLDDSALIGRRTSLGSGLLRIQTTEHFLAALSGLGIDNITAELDGAELPGMDGSAKDFVHVIRRCGIIEQGSPKKILKIKEAVWSRDGDKLVAILPEDNFRVSYTMSYENTAIGAQYFDIEVDEESFISQIAPARTFCLKSEALMLMASGLGKGASWKNALIMGKRGPFKNKLRFKDELVRHKILDLIGDLYILGVPVIGRVIAIKSGHSLNMELVKKLKEKIVTSSQ